MTAPNAPNNPPPDASRPRLVVAGVGMLTPLGHAAWPTFAALLAGRCASDRARRLEPDPDAGDAPGQVDPVNLVRALGGVSVVQHAATDPAVELAERAGREAAFAAGLETTGIPTYLGTSKGAVQALTRSALGFADAQPKNGADPEAVVLGPHGYLTHHLQQRLRIEPRAHTVAACASSLNALDRARRDLLSVDRAAAPSVRDYALAVTADAALLPQFVHSYRRLGVLAPLTPREYRQRPLDAHRPGFMLTEAGAAVLLKRLPPGVAPKPSEVELLDTATANEAHDLVRTDPEMPALRRVANTLLHKQHVDVIHPHAPGTDMHDPAELAVYRDVLPDQSPDLYACKGALGHSLGAAGLTALVIAHLCLQSGQRPPMPWLTDALPGVKANAQPCDRNGTHAVFAAGFGGHVAGAVLRRCG